MAARQAFSHDGLGEDSTTTSGNWSTKTTFTFTPDANSDYFIFFSCVFANSSGTAGHYGEVSVYHDQGSTSVGYWAARSQEVSSPQDWFSVFCVHKSSFVASPGAQDYIVSFNSSHAGDTTKIKDVRLLAIKADAADKYAAVDTSSQGAAGAGYATKTTLTFTPASTGDYLLIASAVLTSEGASTTGARLNHSGGSIYGENLTYPKAAWTYNAWATAAKINLANSSQTFNLQFSPSASVEADIEQARILALRLDKFENAYVAQDFSGGNSTSASNQDYLTLTQTPLALSHIPSPLDQNRCAQSRNPMDSSPAASGSRAGGFHACERSQTRKAGLALAIAPQPVLPFAYLYSVGTLDGKTFRGSILCPRVPLSTLRRHPCGCQRMTRGHRDWLDLQRTELPSAATCRSPGARRGFDPGCRRSRESLNRIIESWRC